MRAELVFNSIVFEQIEIPVITDVSEKPLDMEAVERMPGIIGYIVQPGDTMWNIAKRFSTTADQIKKVNQLDNEILRKGQKLLIMREPQAVSKTAFCC